MTSLIFGTIYMGHKGIVNHRREKQRQKNYERWEGLRDEYDDQRKISRESRSLDIQRTGADYANETNNDRPILTLRDQQEANDARTSWRPQESFDGPRIPAIADNRRTSVEVTAGSGLNPIKSNKTGSTWDEGLPQPLRVSRRTWDDYQPSNLSGNVSRSASLREASEAISPSDRSASNASMVKKASPRPEVAAPIAAPVPQSSSIEPIQSENPGGRMAELIELGNSSQPVPFSNTQPRPSNGFHTAPYSTQATVAHPGSANMQEWWN